MAKFILLSVFAASALAVHLRGRERHGWRRQLTDHSTFVAPYSVLMYAFSAVPVRPFVSLEHLPELRPLLEGWKTLRDDALRLQERGLLGAAEERDDLVFNSLFRRGWRRFYLRWYGEPLASAEAECPDSVALLRSVPCVRGAVFALLPAGAKLKGHRDPFAGSLRLHIGLATPNSDACLLHVDGQPYSWRDGEAVVFDETYIHRAANRSDEDRLILFADVERPLRGAPVRALNQWIASHVVRHSAGRNVPDERPGLMGSVAARVEDIHDAMRRLKRRNRRGYKLGKGLLIAALFFLVFVAGFFRS